DFGGSFTRVRKVLSRPAFTVALLDGDAAGTGALRRRVGGTWLPAAGLPGGAWDVEGWEDPDTGKVVLLAAGEGGGLYQSLDGGASWAPIETWPGTAAWDLEVIGAGSTILATSLCGLETSPWAPAGVPVACGVIRSDDGGETWAQALTLERPCAAIGLDPAVPAQAWAACPGSGLYQTSNAGLSWQNVSSGVGLLSSLPLGFTDVTITGGRLALGSSDSGVFMTLPGSTTTWVSAPESMPRPRLESIRIHADSENGNRILLSALPGGLYVTWNGGTHWHDISGALTPTAGWADRLPLQASFIHAVDAPSPAFGDGVHVWAAVEGAGLWKATPDLWSWSRITTNIPAMDTAHPLALSEAVGGVQNNLHVWLAATEGVIRTTSAGQNWQTVGTGLPPGDLLAFAPPTGGPNLFASVSGRQIFWESFDGAAWAKSETLRAHGRPWPLWPGRRVGFWSWMAPHPTQGARVHLSLDPTGLWSTMDGGLTWDPSGQGLPPGGTFALLRDLDAPESLFVGTTAGVWLSNDGEEFFPAGDWEAAWGTPMELYQDPGDGDRLFAITEPSPRHGLPPETAEETLYPKRALVRSTDRGATWEPVSGGVPENSGPLQVLADPLSEDVYYLATASEGILRSLDGGLSWEPWTIGLPGPRTGAFGRLRGHPMSFSPSGDRLYLGTSGFGIWERVPATGCE
ncbi:MAG: hypothetical protein FJ098_09925, partial [Deltaproteobacteria bacterium]|nr:hypothetical protein [Deltaproteobacteria bacterium]